MYVAPYLGNGLLFKVYSLLVLIALSGLHMSLRSLLAFTISGLS